MLRAQIRTGHTGVTGLRLIVTTDLESMPSAVHPQSPESILLSRQGGFFALSAASADKSGTYHMTDGLTRDTKTRDNGELQTATLTA